MQPALLLSNIRDLHDARYCAAVGIDMLGFKIGQADAALSPTEVAEILDWLSGPVGIAVFEQDEVHQIIELMTASKCGMISLPSTYDPRLLSAFDHPVIIRVDECGSHLEEWLAAYDSLGIEVYLLLPAGLTSGAFDAVRKAGLPAKKLILHAELEEEASGLVEKVGGLPFAISLGGFVMEPDGRLDYGKCDDFLESYLERAAG